MLSTVPVKAEPQLLWCGCCDGIPGTGDIVCHVDHVGTGCYGSGDARYCLDPQ